MKIPKTLLDLYPKPFINGIFFQMSKNTRFAELFSKLGLNDEIDFHSIDTDYIYNRSGLKALSILMRHIISQYIINDSYDYVIDTNGNRLTFKQLVDSISNDVVNIIINTKYYNKWSELITTLSYDYDALNPYNISVDEDTSSTEVTTTSGDGDFEQTVVSSDKVTNKNMQNISRFAFDSPDDESIPTDKTDESRTSDSSGTTKQGGKNTKKTDSDSTNMATRKITRKGNIGNHTLQELIEEQRNLLQYQIFDTIYQDLDEILTRSEYILR